MWPHTMFDDHTKPHYGVTVPQLALLLIWLVSLLLWLTQLRKGLLFKWISSAHHNSTPPDVIVHTTGDTPAGDGEAGDKAPLLQTGGESAAPAVKKPREETVPTHEHFLRSVLILGLILFYFYLCDYRKLLPMGKREYDRDVFLFLVFLLFAAAVAFTIKPTQDKILNRDQTEEWRGWMQVMFVWYHYFAAEEWYNWIRVYIACYVWMTGFGNFSFFWIRKDFSLLRVVKMLFRLNFLVILICATLDNQYMLYYICAMHTYWFLTVYATMAILPSWNMDRVRMVVKLIVYAVCNAIIFDIPGVCQTVFLPFSFIFGYVQPNKTLMHEWAYRGGLDHWVCFLGMLCAYNYPHYEHFILWLEKQSRQMEITVKCALVGVVGVCFAVWRYYVLPLDKFTYNNYHPYTSFVPIFFIFIVRNLTPQLRSYYLHLFAWLGKITLETYLSQLHVYLQSNAKHRIIFFSEYKLLNFALVTAMYIPLSYVLFNLTTVFNSYLLPSNYKTALRNAGYIAAIAVTSSLLALLLKSIFL